MANEFKVKNGLIVDAGGAQITGGITGSTDFNTIVNKPTLISSSAQLSSDNITGSNLRATSAIVSPNITWSGTLGTNGGEIRISQTQYRGGNNITFVYSATTDSNGSRDLGFRRNTSGSLEIYDGNNADGVVANRRDLILRDITGSNATFSGSFNITGSLTASLTTGYAWVGGAGNISRLVATSSFGGTSGFLTTDYDFNTTDSPIIPTGSITFIQDSGSNYQVIPNASGVNFRHLNTTLIGFVNSQSVYFTTPFTASLQQGYAWVGGVGNVSTLVSTSSFGSPINISSLNSFTSSQYVSNSFFATTGSNLFRANQTFSGSLIPAVSGAYDLGTLTNPWRHIYVGSGSIYLVDGKQSITRTISADTLLTTADIASGTVSLTPSLPIGIVSGSAQIVGILGSLNSATASFTPRITNLETTSASVNGYIADNNSKTGSYARTNSTNTFNGNQIITGSVYITQDLVVLGSSSIQTISSSRLDIGDNIIQLNVNSPSLRFGGLAINDSGSAGNSGSFLYDSVHDEFIFVHKGNGTNVTSSHFVLGPETFDNLGNETYLTTNRLPKGTGKEHLVDSNITDTGTLITLASNTTISGSTIFRNSSNGTSVSIGGTAYGIRIDNGGTFSTGRSTIFGVDNTFIGSYQPLGLQGSIVYIGTSTTDIMTVTSTAVSISANVNLGTIGGGSSTATPNTINLGSTFSNTAGSNLKLKLFEDTGGNTYGIGVSNSQMDFNVASGGGYRFYTGNATFSANVLPAANGTQDLGSTSYRWSTIYTSDLSLNNGIGDWTIVEGEDDLFLYNNKKGKVYKFALTEVDPNVATPKKS